MTPDLDIRPFQLHDADVVAQLHTASVLGQWTYRPEHFRESTDPARRRLVALRDKDVVATASLAPFGDSAPDALRLDLAGDPQAFTPLYLALLAVCPVGYPQLLGVTREDFTDLTFF
ncbi:hypothetical protein LAJ19_16150 (plasmid) [Deinococcus taeanensis]|uniref:hypothetical protein n=1 Tax=Deinococcus taeanensis TaxID=2737050 RepID=UPI001CDD54CD|nr:hypothetical protein [Deinococcus taeanensis]UBV44692.1 hypothetical protein LAJ19_16150 [Deinococcus taeanensis]